jgi:RHS repeat-associated protein
MVGHKKYIAGYDGNGNTRFLTTTNASVANVFAFDAFGTLIASNAAPQTDYLFAGEQRDANLGFIYLRARYLNTGTGRFWTRDDFEGNREMPLSLHKYLYGHDDPVGNTDPGGNEIEVTLAVLSISGNLAAQISPVTSGATQALPSVAWGASRSLTDAEIDLARTLFGGKVAYSRTGVDYGRWAWWQPEGREMTPDGIIHTGGQTISDYTVAGAKPKWSYGLLAQQGILIHELVHVWQYQRGVNVVLKGLYRNYAYAGPNFGKLAFSDYGIEQQAQMAEDYYYLRNGSTSATVPTPTPSLSTYEKIIPFLPK